MKQLIAAFLKIFFRNRRAIFFVIVLPALIYVILAFLRVEQVLQFDIGLSYTDFLLPGIIAYAIMNMGVYTVTYSLIDYKRQLILKRLSVTPLASKSFLLAHSLARFVVAMIQTAVLLAIGVGIFSAQIKIAVFLLPFVILLGCLVFLNFGYIISALAREYEEAAPYTSIIGLTLGFFGDVFFPVANLPKFLQDIAAILPMKPFTALMRYSLLA